MYKRILETLAEHGDQLQSIDLQLAEHTKQFQSIDRRFADHDKRFDRLEDQLHQSGLRQEIQDSKIDQILEIVLLNQDQLQKMNHKYNLIDNHEMRISALELNAKSRL